MFKGLTQHRKNPAPATKQITGRAMRTMARLPANLVVAGEHRIA
jgi:hypothetical protein